MSSGMSGKAKTLKQLEAAGLVRTKAQLLADLASAERKSPLRVGPSKYDSIASWLRQLPPWRRAVHGWELSEELERCGFAGHTIAVEDCIRQMRARGLMASRKEVPMVDDPDAFEVREASFYGEPPPWVQAYGARMAMRTQMDAALSCWHVVRWE